MISPNPITIGQQQQATANLLGGGPVLGASSSTPNPITIGQQQQATANLLSGGPVLGASSSTPVLASGYDAQQMATTQLLGSSSAPVVGTMAQQQATANL